VIRINTKIFWVYYYPCATFPPIFESGSVVFLHNTINEQTTWNLTSLAEVIWTSCAGGRHNMPRPLQVDLWPFDLESGVRVTSDVGYLCANFCLPRPICSRLRPDVRDRQTDR